ncbi:MAG: hypothetical protein DWQ01_15915 [Planctomycetota bacterium]|nr:MAG: hypothetical protein DWQ01_15915 [Planctomycetota bacterium]
MNPVPSTSPSDSQQDLLLGQAVETLLEQGAEALQNFFAEQPAEMAQALKNRLACLLEAGFLEGETPPVPEALGDFQLLKALGGGGMGMVYLARQQSLDRLVAVKVIRPDQLFFPGARARFRREIEAVSRFQHPGIASIFAVGESEALPYFAMEYLPGCTLAEVLQEAKKNGKGMGQGSDLAAAMQRAWQAKGGDPADVTGTVWQTSWTQLCLRWVQEVAEALEHAHRRGIVHRDVKPSNLLLSPQGRVLLIDFGLAASESTGEITRSGSQPGSLPYMSPEQLLGKRVDARTDVYSLGVSLFEMLCLQAPFGSENGEGLRRQILEGRAPALKTLCPEISWEVETVCMLAMAPEVSHRYASAEALARDCALWLQGLPIEGKRPPVWRRSVLWAKRRPAVALALALAFLLVVVAPSVFAWVVSGKNRHIQSQFKQLDTTYQALSRSQKEERRQSQLAAAEARKGGELADLLLEAFLVPDPLAAEVPAVADPKEAIAFAQRTVQTDPILGADLLFKLGKAYLNLGLEPEAGTLLQQTVDLRRLHLRENHPDLAEARLFLGRWQQRHLRYDQAAILYEAALQSLPDPADWQRALALSWKASLIAAQGNLQEATAVIEQARRGFQLAGERQSPAFADGLAAHGQILYRSGRLPQAEATLQKAYEVTVVAYGENHPKAGRVLLQQARVVRLQAEFERSLRLAEQAQALLQNRLGKNHGYTLEARLIRGSVLSVMRDFEAAREVLDACLKDFTGEGAREQRYRGTVLGELAKLDLHQNRLDQAEDRFRSSLELLQAQLGEEHAELAPGYQGLAMTLLRRGRVQEADPWFLKALEIYRRTEVPGSLSLGECLYWRACGLAASGNLTAAEPLFLESLQVFRLGVGLEHPMPVHAMERLSTLCQRLDRQEESEAWQQKARQAMAAYQNRRRASSGQLSPEPGEGGEEARR